MNKTAIAFSTKDRVELSTQTIVALLQHTKKFDLFWSDGSTTEKGENLPRSICTLQRLTFGRDVVVSHNVQGGADAAIVFNLTVMLRHPNNYDYIGLCENDVLLDPDWFELTMALFEKGKADGLEVGAVSARCYEDRVLIQRDGYAVCHNLGAGHIILTRKAAELVLANFRTGWTTENRRAFMQISGLDIGAWWAFRGQQHSLCADWGFDRVLAQHGLASLALTPAKCTMIGQEPPLEQQGLKLATGPVEARRNDKAFATFVERTRQIREGKLRLPDSRFLRSEEGTYTYFPHQLEQIGATFEGDWLLKWSQGFGPFAWKARSAALQHPEEDLQIETEMFCPVSGPCALLVSGGKDGGKVQIMDEASGFDNTIRLDPESNGQVFQMQVPAGVSYRNVRLVALSPGIVFYGLITREPQPVVPSVSFDHSRLPPV